MSIKTKQDTNYSVWFVTFTCFDWINLFDLSNSYHVVYKWFSTMTEKELADVLSYVIMPNHLHVIVHIQNDANSLNKIVANGKRFMAYEIIKLLKTTDNHMFLDKLTSSLSEREKKKGQRHKVFIESFDSKAI